MGELVDLPPHLRLPAVHQPRIGTALHGIADELADIADRSGAAAGEIRDLVQRLEALADRALSEDHPR